MGLKSFFIIMAIFYSKDSITAFSFFLLLLILGSICIFFKKIFLQKNEYFALTILFFSIVAVILSLGIAMYFPIWHKTNKILIFILPLLPIALLEYAHFEKKYILNKFAFFLRGLVILSIFKELISYGTIFNIQVIKNYEGVLFFDTFSGTLILIACGLIIYERLGDRFANKWN